MFWGFLLSTYFLQTMKVFSIEVLLTLYSEGQRKEKGKKMKRVTDRKDGKDV